MKKWEYKELFFEVKYRPIKKPHTVFVEDYMQELNKEGKNGWEVVQILQHGGSSNHDQEIRVILKREIQTGTRSFF
jgi:hypothetical protein